MKVKIDRDAIYTPVTPFSGDLDGEPVVFNPGMRLKGSHPAVSTWPALFEKESDLDELEEKRRVANEPRYTVPTEDTTKPRVVDHKLRARRDIRLLIDGNERQTGRATYSSPMTSFGRWCQTPSSQFPLKRRKGVGVKHRAMAVKCLVEERTVGAKSRGPSGRFSSSSAQRDTASIRESARRGTPRALFPT